MSEEQLKSEFANALEQQTARQAQNAIGARKESKARQRTDRQKGSISVITLLGFGALVGAFLYVAVIGGRTAETMRARNAADATAMASATIKAKVLNYEGFIVLAESVLLPLGEISAHIKGAQIASSVLCWGAAIATLSLSVAKVCLKYDLKHVPSTWRAQGDVDDRVQGWLVGLQETGMLLGEYGPLWAEFVASRVGMNGEYRGTGGRGVSVVASYPIPRWPKISRPPAEPGRCNDLGLRWVDSNESIPSPDGDKDVCHGIAGGALEVAYLLASGNPEWILLDAVGLALTGHMLPLGANCTSGIQVPALTHDRWTKTRMSRGMALAEQPMDSYYKGFLERLRGTTPPKTLHTGYLLGMGCAEHYAQEHYGQESLWYMDWRARLVPCEYEKKESQEDVFQCALPMPAYLPGADMPNPLHVPLIALQFGRQLALGIARNWRY